MDDDGLDEVTEVIARDCDDEDDDVGDGDGLDDEKGKNFSIKY